jgi:hypothetical protein
VKLCAEIVLTLLTLLALAVVVVALTTTPRRMSRLFVDGSRGRWRPARSTSGSIKGSRIKGPPNNKTGERTDSSDCLWTCCTDVKVTDMTFWWYGNNRLISVLSKY